MKNKEFPGIGVWRLVSDENVADDSTVTYPVGKDGTGQIMYDAKGNMAAQVGSIHRPSFAAPDRLRGTPEEIKTAFEGYTAYFGTYTFDEKRGTVTHHVKNSVFPNWNGSDQVRYCEFSGNRLILRTAPMLVGGKKVTAIITWERVS